MEQTKNMYVTVAYDLYSDNAEGVHELIEKAPEEHPFQFISGMGLTLDAFEEKIMALQAGDNFDFTLSVDEAYGEYHEEHVIELAKEMFCIDGRFDKNMVYPGNVIPLVNADGNRFQGLILEVKDNVVVVDLNHPLAGRVLHFCGKVVVSREATDDEIKGVVNMLSGEGCGCGCDDCGGGCHEEGHAHEGCCDGGCCH